uniref:Major sperm protein n=1 Tax=Caenorhabditis japonica TaxID=281687 RepID=A0A8R1IFE6_CAEJA
MFFKIKSSNKNEYRIIPIGSTGVGIIRTAEAPKKDKPFVQFAPAPADALAVFAFVTPAGTLTITISVFFGTPLEK